MIHLVLKGIMIAKQPIDDKPVIREKIKQLYAKCEFLKSSDPRSLEVNGVHMMRQSAFDEFVDYVVKHLEELGYFRRYPFLKNQLLKTKGIGNSKVTKHFDREELLLEFIFKNQRGVHIDDLENIFKIMKVESYSQVALTRGFTMLVKESDSTRG